MAADVRRWGGYCRRTSSIAAVTLGASGATLSTSTCWPLAIMAIRRPVDPADIWPAHASVWACHACAPARRYRTPAPLAPPFVTRGGGGLGTLSPLHCLCWLCCWLCLAQRRHVALKSFHLGGQPVTLLGDVRQPRLAVPPVLVGPGQTGLEVAVGGLRADRACLPRPRPLLVHPLLHHPPLPPPTGSACSARFARSAAVAVRGALGGGGACPLRGALSACAWGVRRPRRQWRQPPPSSAASPHGRAWQAMPRPPTPPSAAPNP